MDAVLDRPMTLEAFLEWERRQELRYEFDGVGPVAMNGGTLIHAEIAARALHALKSRLGTGSGVSGFQAVKILVAGRLRYPDVVATKSAIDWQTDILPEPVLVLEVLSPSTEAEDRGQKNIEYCATPSIEHYVLLEQARPLATIYSRTGHGWGSDTVTSEGVLRLTALGVDVPLTEIYGGLILAEAAG